MPAWSSKFRGGLSTRDDRPAVYTDRAEAEAVRRLEEARRRGALALPIGRELAEILPAEGAARVHRVVLQDAEGHDVASLDLDA